MRFGFALSLLIALSIEMAVARTSQSDHVQQVAIGSEPAAVTDAAGAVHAVFVGGGERVFYTESASGTSKWVQSIGVAKTDGGCSEPDIALGRAGSICVVWNNSPLPHAFGSIVFSRSSDGGKTWYEPLKISGQEPAAQPALVASHDGSLYAVWLTAIAKGQAAIRISSSVDGGTSWTMPQTVAKGSNLMTAPAISVDADNVLHVVWIDHDQAGSGKDVHYICGNGTSWTPVANLSSTTKDCAHPRIACGAKGKIFVAWTEYDDNYCMLRCAVKNRKGGFAKFIITSGIRLSEQIAVCADALGKVGFVAALVKVESPALSSGPGSVWARISRNGLDEISNDIDLAKGEIEEFHCAAAISGNRMISLWEEGGKSGSVIKSTSISFNDFPTGPATPGEGPSHQWHHGY